MYSQKAYRLIQLANEARHYYVTRDSEIVNFGGCLESPNARHVMDLIDSKGAAGPFTLREAKGMAVARFDKRLLKTLKAIRVVRGTLEMNSRWTDKDFLPFKKTP